MCNCQNSGGIVQNPASMQGLSSTFSDLNNVLQTALTIGVLLGIGFIVYKIAK